MCLSKIERSGHVKIVIFTSNLSHLTINAQNVKEIRRSQQKISMMENTFYGSHQNPSKLIVQNVENSWPADLL